MMLKTKRRRLFFDCETSPNIGFFWEAGYKKNIDYTNIIKERAIICICYKWEDEKEVHSLQWDSKQNDKKLLLSFVRIANQATELVGHNGDKFDLAWIRTRCLFHRIDMFPDYVTIDTLKISRSKFKFNSNRLNYIAKFLGFKGKIKTDFSMWREITLNNDKTALDKMVKYCKRDVLELEGVFKELRKHVVAKSHYGVIFDRATNKNIAKYSCPECGSDDLIQEGLKVTPAGTRKIRYKCGTCGTHHTKTDK